MVSAELISGLNEIQAPATKYGRRFLGVAEIANWLGKRI